MLIVLIGVTVSASLMAEWLLDHIRCNYEIDWSVPTPSTDPET